MASTPNDPFAKPVLIGGLLLLGTAVFVLVSNLFSTIEKNSTVGADDNSMYEAASNDNLTPIGEVVAVDKTIAPKARTGEEVFSSVCTTCHTTGVLNAPKLEKAAWSERVSKGLDGLLNSAINGLNQMPARGGDPSLSDEEMKSALQYMLAQAGYEDIASAGGDTQSAAQTATAQPESDASNTGAPAEETNTQASQEQAPQETTEQASQATDTPSDTAQTAAAAPVVQASIDGEKVYNSLCMTCHNVGVANAPKLEAAAWTERAQNGLDTIYNHAINGLNAMPPKGGNPSLSDDEVKAAVDYMLKAAGVSIN